jgi:hypothetical protein
LTVLVIDNCDSVRQDAGCGGVEGMCACEAGDAGADVSGAVGVDGLPVCADAMLPLAAVRRL